MKKPTRLSASRAKRPVRVVPASSPAAELPYAPGREARAIVRADLYEAVARFQSTDVVTRRYLCGVRIEGDPRKGTVMVATDGQAMAVSCDENGFHAGIPITWNLGLIKLKTWLAFSGVRRPILKSMRPYLSFRRSADWPFGRVDLIMATDAADIRAGSDNDSTDKLRELTGTADSPLAIDCEMPLWRRVLPTDASLTDKTAPPPVYDARLMAKLMEFATNVQQARRGRVDRNVAAPIMITGTAHCPALVRLMEHDGDFAIMMPMTNVGHTKAKDGCSPDWATQAQPERKKLGRAAAPPAVEAQAEVA